MKKYLSLLFLVFLLTGCTEYKPYIGISYHTVTKKEFVPETTKEVTTTTLIGKSVMPMTHEETTPAQWDLELDGQSLSVDETTYNRFKVGDKVKVVVQYDGQNETTTATKVN